MKSFFATSSIVLALLVASAHDAKAQRITDSLIGASMSSALVDTATHSAAPRDTFLGSDKVKHFSLSAFIELVGFSGLEGVGAGRGPAMGMSTAGTMIVGIAREIHDLRTKKLFSLGDLTWDAIGTGAALALASHTQR